MSHRTRRIGPVLATVLVAGNMIGSGIYLLPAQMAGTGSATVLAWAIASAGALAIAGVFAFLAVIRPGADGVVTYAAGLHPALGFVSWLSYWTSGWVGNVAVGVGAVGYLAVFFPGLAAPLLGLAALVGVIWATTLANLAGPRLTAGLSGTFLVVGLVPILAATALGFMNFDPALFAASWNVTGKPTQAVLPGVLAPIFWAFLGLESANVAAAVVDDPRRNLPIAALGGVALASAVYVAATAAMFGVLPAAVLAASSAPFADVTARLAGPAAGALVAACAFVKTCGTLCGFILVTAESGRAGAESGFLPRVVSEVDPDREPVRDTLLVAALMTLAAFVTLSPTVGQQFSRLTSLSVVFFLAVYALCALALIRAAKDFAWPAVRWAARLVAGLALAFSVWVTAASDKALTLPAFALLAAAVPIWLLVQLSRRMRPAPAAPDQA